MPETVNSDKGHGSSLVRSAEQLRSDPLGGSKVAAGIVDAVENAPHADQGELRTREILKDDVPEEYLDED